MWVRGNRLWVLAMSVRHHRGGWETRWRDASGRSRSKRFKSEEAARAYDDAVPQGLPRPAPVRTPPGPDSASPATATRAGIPLASTSACVGATAARPRKRSSTSQRAAADARRRLVEQVERREIVHTTETFGRYWARWLTRRRPYLEEGTSVQLRSQRPQAAVACPRRQASGSAVGRRRPRFRRRSGRRCGGRRTRGQDGQ